MFALVAAAAAALPSVDVPVPGSAPAAGDAAVVVGIEDYAFLPDVPRARDDARAVYETLLTTRGVPADHVVLLRDAPSREQILAAVETAVGKAAPDGTVWVYFSGHGSGDPTDGARLLLGVDVQASGPSFSARGVRVDEVRAILGRRAGPAVLLLDTCYAGAGRGGEALVPGGRFAVPSFATAAPAIAEWTAAGPNQISGPAPDGSHGAFTWLVLGALRGWADGAADGRTDGRVTLQEADRFVARSIDALQIRDQTPSLVGGDPSWTLSTGREGAPTLSVGAAAPAPAPVPPPAPAAGEVLADVDYSRSAPEYVHDALSCRTTGDGIRCTSTAADANGALWSAFGPVGARALDRYELTGRFRLQPGSQAHAGFAFGQEGARWSGVMIRARDGAIWAGGWDGQLWATSIDWQPFLGDGSGEHTIRAVVKAPRVKVWIDDRFAGQFDSTLPLAGSIGPLFMGAGEATWEHLTVRDVP